MKTQSRDGWTRCPPGTFRRLAADLTARRLRAVWMARFAWAVAAVLAGTVAWQAATAVTTGRFAWSGWGGSGTSSCHPAPCAPAATPTPATTPPANAPAQPGCGAAGSK